MSYNKTNMYDVEPHIAEIYDQIDAYTDDVELIRNLIGNSGPLRILEPFCGTGRILIPLATDGHELVGLDQAKFMLNHARKKIGQLPEQVQSRINLHEADVTSNEWPPLSQRRMSAEAFGQFRGRDERLNRPSAVHTLLL